MLTLGVPGNAVSAIFLGGLLIHGLRPGAALFTENATITWLHIQPLSFKLVICSGRVHHGPLCYQAATYAAFDSRAHYHRISCYRLPCDSGIAADVLLMLGMGLVGCIMRRNSIPAAPMVLGLVLGTMAEGELARALAIVRGDILAFGLQLVTRPISLVILALCVLSIWQGIARQANKKRMSNQIA